MKGHPEVIHFICRAEPDSRQPYGGSRCEPRLKSLADEIIDGGGKSLALATDVTKRDDVNALVDTAVRTYGRIDAMINNAGLRLGSDENSSLEDGRAHVAQVDRQGCALILADTWPEKIGKGLMFISLNVEQNTREAAMAVPDAPTACSGHHFLTSGIIVPAMQF